MNATTEISNTLPGVHLGCMVAADPIPAEISGRISQYSINPGQVLNQFNPLSACTGVCLPQYHWEWNKLWHALHWSKFFPWGAPKEELSSAPNTLQFIFWCFSVSLSNSSPALTTLDFIQQYLYFPCAQVTSRRSHCTRESVGGQQQPDLEIQWPWYHWPED